jgi:hypothetical protein
MLRMPWGGSDRHGIELAIELSGAGTAEEREIEEVCQAFRIRVNFRGG